MCVGLSAIALTNLRLANNFTLEVSSSKRRQKAVKAASPVTPANFRQLPNGRQLGFIKGSAPNKSHPPSIPRARSGLAVKLSSPISAEDSDSDEFRLTNVGTEIALYGTSGRSEIFVVFVSLTTLQRSDGPQVNKD